METSFIPKELIGKDIYKILGLTINDSTKENIKNIIRKKYLKCALILHPDKKDFNFKVEEKDKYAENFNILKSAYEFLMNEKLRKKYNLYVQKKIKKNTPINNTSLNRYLDKKKFVTYQNQKLFYKKKLEEKEKLKCTPSNNEKEQHNLNKEIDLKKIKKQNEEFMKKSIQENIKKKKYIHDNNKLIEIYLDDYDNNINLLKLYIKKKYFLNFFINFNFLKYYLNLNDEEKENKRKVGYIIFSHRFETIRAFIYYKKNLDKINNNFKLKLLIPCNEDKEMYDEKIQESENIDEMMNEMVDELDKIFSTGIDNI
ncbi:DnaJ protein, putative [Plasmodium gallinaceum]|uniref:DnaJ protein, putative n=1 Tax=Plasmodium gallinaceum TaxID=5849 RepID=A0A1J1GXJ4_PLAGA|nr:DnaJ protein, putative [Plasmodium gallinaceum]CRG95736.1 DnaJ protein, putative [Plasmodium gallinaceum]